MHAYRQPYTHLWCLAPNSAQTRSYSQAHHPKLVWWQLFPGSYQPRSLRPNVLGGEGRHFTKTLHFCRFLVFVILNDGFHCDQVCTGQERFKVIHQKIEALSAKKSCWIVLQLHWTWKRFVSHEPEHSLLLKWKNAPISCSKKNSRFLKYVLLSFNDIEDLNFYVFTWSQCDSKDLLTKRLQQFVDFIKWQKFCMANNIILQIQFRTNTA